MSQASRSFPKISANFRDACRHLRKTNRNSQRRCLGLDSPDMKEDAEAQFMRIRYHPGHDTCQRSQTPSCSNAHATERLGTPHMRTTCALPSTRRRRMLQKFAASFERMKSLGPGALPARSIPANPSQPDIVPSPGYRPGGDSEDLAQHGPLVTTFCGFEVLGRLIKGTSKVA